MIPIGPAGSDGRGNLNGLRKVVEMGLDCMEVAFTCGVRLDPDTAREVKKLTRKQGIVLSVQAPCYFSSLIFFSDCFLAFESFSFFLRASYSASS